jgi:hypothetical protein
MSEVGYKKPPKEHQFKPGQVANPLGGRAHNPELRAIKRLTAAEVAEIGSLVVLGDLQALQEIVKESRDPWLYDAEGKHSVLKVWMATIAIKAIQKGDVHGLDVLLNRLIGRTAEKIQISDPDGGPVKHLIGRMTPEEKKAELEKLRKLRAQAGED